MSQFEESTSASTLTSTNMSSVSAATVSNRDKEEYKEQVLITVRLEYTHRQDWGDSDDEGEEVVDHFDPFLSGSTLETMEAHRDELDTDNPGEDFFVSAIPGAPEGWAPPGPT